MLLGGLLLLSAGHGIPLHGGSGAVLSTSCVACRHAALRPSAGRSVGACAAVSFPLALRPCAVGRGPLRAGVGGSLFRRRFLLAFLRLYFTAIGLGFAFAFRLLWLLDGLAFGASRGGYCLFLIFEMICQVSLTPRPSTAENGTGSSSGIISRRIPSSAAFNWLLLFNLSTLVTITR